MRREAAILVGHGSKARNFQTALSRVASAIRRSGDYDSVRCAYLEVSRPSIPEAIEASVRDGMEVVRVLPYFLLTGNHVRHDIPGIVREARRCHRKKARIILCPYLGYDRRLVAVVSDRLRGKRG